MGSGVRYGVIISSIWCLFSFIVIEFYLGYIFGYYVFNVKEGYTDGG